MMKKSEQLRAFCRWRQRLPTATLDAMVEWFNKIKRMQSKRVDIHLVNDASDAPQDWEDITVDEAERALLLWDGK